MTSKKTAWEVEEGGGRPGGTGGGESEPESESDLSPSDVEETSWCAGHNRALRRRPAAHPWPLSTTPGHVMPQGLMVLLSQGQRVLCGSRGGLHPGRLQPHRTERAGAALRVRAGHHPRCGEPCDRGLLRGAAGEPTPSTRSSSCSARVTAAACTRHTRMRTCARHPHPHPHPHPHASTHTAA